MSKPLLVIRSRARGDVLMITPVLRALHAQDRSRRIFVQTEYGGIFQYNPCVHETFIRRPGLRLSCDVIDLDRMIYEQTHETHLVDAFARHAGVQIDSRSLNLYPSRLDIDWALQLGFQDIILAPGPAMWTGKNWHPQNWHDLAKALKVRGHRITLVGAEKIYRIPCDLDLRGQTTFHQLAAVLQNTRLFIGIDSFPAHVASAVGCEAVTLWGITSPQFIQCSYVRHIDICSDPDHPLTGARHDCRVKKLNYNLSPMHTITLESVLDAVTQ